MYDIDEYTTVVSSEAELIAAVGPGNSYNYIYLGENIQIPASGIEIDPNKTSLVIDGFWDNVRHVITDADSTSDVATICVREDSSIVLTFKNLTLEGRNYYGIPFVNESEETSGVTVIYDNISYEGPQITFNPNGLTRYIDCDITISYPPDTDRVEEVGEVNRVEFGGVNTIRHDSTSDAVFWFRGENATAYFKVLQGARVTISTSNYFMFSMTPIIPLVQNPVAYEIQPGAVFELTSHRGFSLGISHRASSFLVDTGAAFRYIQETANSLSASLYIDGNFVVNTGADVYMQAAYSGARQLINFTSSGAITVNNPRSFVLYDGGGAALAFGVSRTFEIIGCQLNQWTQAPSVPDVGGMDDIAQSRWYMPDGSWTPFRLAGSVTIIPSETTVSEYSFSQDELAQLPPLGDLQLQSARILSIGNLPIVQNPVTDGDAPVTGWTIPAANLRVIYAGDTINSAAEESGRYAVYKGSAVQAGTSVTVSSNTPFLITTIMTDAIIEGEFQITAAPAEIVFRRRPILTSPIALITRTNPEEPVRVSDSRQESSRWELLLSVTGPLETAGGEIWENGVVFVGDDIEDRAVLRQEPMVVYTSEPDEEITDVFWEEEKGILLQVNQPVRFGVSYSTSVIWDLRII